MVEALISINNKLQQKEAAEGLLQYVMNRSDIQVQVRWYEKLHNWDKALSLYEEKLETFSDDQEACLGRMRCLEALGKWENLHEMVEEKFNHLSEDNKQRTARLAAASAWGLHYWDSMERQV